MIKLLKILNTNIFWRRIYIFAILFSGSRNVFTFHYFDLILFLCSSVYFYQFLLFKLWILSCWFTPEYIIESVIYEIISQMQFLNMVKRLPPFYYAMAIIKVYRSFILFIKMLFVCWKWNGTLSVWRISLENLKDSMETFSYDIRKIDCNWKIAFIYLESSGTFIICISSLIMWLWGLTFHLEMRKSNHEFISFYIFTSQSTAWRGTCKHIQTDEKWPFLICSGWKLRLYLPTQHSKHCFGDK